MSTTRTSEKQRTTHFKKRLGLPDVISQSVSVMAPAMSGAFLTYQASIKAGGATPLAFLGGTIAMLFVGLTVAQFSKSVSSAGGLYTYVAQGLGKTWGFVAGWLYIAAFLIIGGAVMAGFGFFSAQTIQSITGSSAPISWLWFFSAGILASALLSMFNVEVSTRTQLLLSVITIGIMVVVSMIVIGIGSPETSVLDGQTEIANPGASFDMSAFNPGAAGASWMGILFGMSFAMLSFTGAETSATLAEETRNPHKNVPIAVVGSIVIVGIVYLIITYATSIGFGVQQAANDWPASVAGLGVVAPNRVMETLVLGSAAVASFLCALGLHNTVSRVLFTMGREHVLPRWLGELCFVNF